MLNYDHNDNYYNIWDDFYRSYRVNSEAAIQIALQRVPGRVVKVELDYEDGVLVYEIDILTPYGLYEVKVHGVTGQILKIEREFD